MMLKQEEIKQVLEAALLASGEPISIDRMMNIFEMGQLPEGNSRQAVRSALGEIEYALKGHAYELKHVSSGYRFQVRQDFSPWVSRLWEERPPRYSRALMETLALIAYRQPVTRGDIEQVRGVSVSQNIMRTLLERGWIRVGGRREVPGRPSLYGTTRAFLDYFGLKTLDELPPMEEIKSIIEPVLSEELKDRDDEMRGEDQERSTERPLAEVVQLPIADR
jgi:segregation and condensation protein B